MSATSTAYSWIRIETPENIEFTYELAGPGTRMAAYFIDFLIMLIVYSLVVWLVYLIYDPFEAWMRGGPTWLEDVLVAVAIAITSLLFPLGGYWTFFETVMHGQTPAKRMLGIRVIQRTGAPAHLAQLVIRNLFRLIECFFPFQYAIGCLSLVFSRNTQRLGDQVTGLIVVKERKKEKASVFQWKENAGRFVLDRTKNIELAKEEFDLLLEYIRICKDLRPADRNRISHRLSTVILDRAELWHHPDFAPLVEEVRQSPPHNRYQANERILGALLNLYLQRDH